MAGHSKWANIKHRKGAQDARRAKMFTKVAREITVAAKEGGGDQTSNPRLRSAIAAARAVNMPNDRIDRAIKKGTGAGGTESFEEVIYEGYGPGGTAIHVTALTDNRNRTTAEIRFLFSRHGGELGSPGSVAWMFERKGLIIADVGALPEESLLEMALDAGALDIKLVGDHYEILTAPDAFHEVREALESAGLAMSSAEVTMVPQTIVPLDPDKAQAVLSLLSGIEDQDDVQSVSANCQIPDADADA